MKKKYQQNLDKGRFKFSPAYKSLQNGQDDEGEGRNHTWDDNRAGVSRSQISKETGGPVQLLWANMWRHETAKAKTANSLQPEGQDTQQIYCTEILQRDFSTILFRSEKNKWTFFERCSLRSLGKNRLQPVTLAMEGTTIDMFCCISIRMRKWWRVMEETKNYEGWRRTRRNESWIQHLLTYSSALRMRSERC